MTGFRVNGPGSRTGGGGAGHAGSSSVVDRNPGTERGVVQQQNTTMAPGRQMAPSVDVEADGIAGQGGVSKKRASTSVKRAKCHEMPMILSRGYGG